MSTNQVTWNFNASDYLKPTELRSAGTTNSNIFNPQSGTNGFNLSAFGDYSSLGMGDVFSSSLSLCNMADAFTQQNASIIAQAEAYNNQVYAQGLYQAQQTSALRDQLKAMGINPDSVLGSNQSTANTSNNQLTSLLSQLGLGGTTTNTANTSNSQLTSLLSQLGLGGITTNTANTSNNQLSSLLGLLGLGGTATSTTTTNNSELDQLAQMLGLGGTAAPVANTSNNQLSSILGLLGLGGTATNTANTSNNQLGSLLSLLGLGGTTTATKTVDDWWNHTDDDSESDADDSFWNYIDSKVAQSQQQNQLQSILALFNGVQA